MTPRPGTEPSGPLVAVVERAPAIDADAELHWTARDDGAIEAWGAAVTLEGADLAALADPAREILHALQVHAPADAPLPRLFGGQCFDPSVSGVGGPWAGLPRARLVLPRWTLFDRGGERWRCWVGAPGEAEGRHRCLPVGRLVSGGGPTRPVDDPAARAAWDARVRAALIAMARGEAEKLVAARCERWTRPGGWSNAELVARMPVEAGARFVVPLGGDARLVAATPEVLVARTGDEVRCDALAGSIPRRTGDDDARIAALRASVKDQREHAVVASFLCDALRSLGLAVTRPTEPSVRSLASVHHLWTPVTGHGDPAPDALTLAAALHPTPAVAGLPRDVALRWIAAHEEVSRGWYAGAVGWCDASGDGRWVVALRSMLVRGDEAWAWAGAGLVPGSEAAAEWAETEAKLRTARVALGAS